MNVHICKCISIVLMEGKEWGPIIGTSWISCTKSAASDSRSSLWKLPKEPVVFPYIFVMKRNKNKKIKCSL
jgi:hypothetical protein